MQGKALSVLDAILKTAEADHYKIYYHERLHILHELCNSRKDIVKNRAEKLFIVINSFVPPPREQQQILQEQQLQYEQEQQRHQQQQPYQNNYYHQQQQMYQQQQQQPEPEIDLLQGFDDDPLDHSTVISTGDAVVPETAAPSAFGFIGAPQPPVFEEASAAPMASAPPMTESGFGFLNASPPAPQPPAPVQAPQPAVHLSSTSRPAHDRPLRVEDLSTSMQRPQQHQQYPNATMVAPQAAAPTASAFAFIAGGGGAPPAPAPVPAARPLDVWDALPAPTPVAGSGIIQQIEPDVEKEEEKVHDHIHDAFEGLDSSADADLDLLDHTHVSLETPYPEPTLTSEPLREVILDIELPPGPMGLVLDRTIADMAVIERFIPLPTGEKGYLEMHPAICPGCALISINSVNVENKGLEEIGPVLAAFAAMPKVLRFKKLMNNGRTANPSTMLMPYIPPPPEEDEQAKKASSEHMARLTEFSDALDEIEGKLEDVIRREQMNMAIVDRKNQLAQLHGNVEKIQTQGIDAVILGPNPPPNFDEVKKFRSSLVRKADALTKRIQRTVDGTPASPTLEPVAAPVVDPVGSPVSAFAFVSGSGSTPAAAVANDPLTLPPATGGSSFHFLNPSTPPVQTAPVESSFGFMQETATPASSFAFLQSNAPPQPQKQPVSDVTSVFAGLSVREDPSSSVNASAMSAGPLTLSALTMSSSMSSVSTLDASGLGLGGVMGMNLAPTPASSYSAFGFLSSTSPTDDEEDDDEVSSMAPTTVSSPTAFGFLRSSTSSSSQPPAQGPFGGGGGAAGPASSAFAFISPSEVRD